MSWNIHGAVYVVFREVSLPFFPLQYRYRVPIQDLGMLEIKEEDEVSSIYYKPCMDVIYDLAENNCHATFY